MGRHPISMMLVAGLAVSAPVSVSADAGDFIAGGIVGALIHKGITDNQKAKQAPKKTYRSSGSNQSGTSLNGQYSRAERIQIQTAFRDLGYNIGTIDGVLGKRSRAAIRQFQASRGEVQSGQLTRPQYVALLSQAPGVNPVYARRQLGPDEVIMLQQGLQVLGFYYGPIDGANGPGTTAALNGFLAQRGTSLAMVTPVQGLVMVRDTAGLPSAPYLRREAGAQIAPAQPFGTQQAGFGPANQQPTPGFGGQGVAQPSTPFAAPGTQQPLGGAVAPAAPGQVYPAPGAPNAAGQPQYTTAPQQQAPAVTPLFGAPSQGQTVPAAGAPAPQQNMFAPTAPVQQQPAPVVPGGQTNTLYAATPSAPQAAPQPVTQSSLDIYSGTTPGAGGALSGQSQQTADGTALD